MNAFDVKLLTTAKSNFYHTLYMKELQLIGSLLLPLVMKGNTGYL